MILFDSRWIGNHGIGRFAKEVMVRLPEVQKLEGLVSPVNPLDPLWTSWQIARNKPSVFFSPGYNPPLFSRSPFVFTIHDLNHIHILANSSPLKRMYYRTVIHPACYRAFKVLTVSEFTRRSIIEWSHISEDKVVNVGNGVGPEYSPEGEMYNPGHSYLLYIGNHKPHKNLKGLLEAFALSGVSTDVKLVISGEPDKVTMNILKEKKLEKDVVFAGLIPEAKLPSYYRGAEALALPSLYEGFGLPVLEAMACGTPVLTSNCTAIPEVAGQACLLVNPRNTDEIATAIHQVLEDENLREKMRTLGIERSKLFSWEKTAALVQNILEEAAKNG